MQHGSSGIHSIFLSSWLEPRTSSLWGSFWMAGCIEHLHCNCVKHIMTMNYAAIWPAHSFLPFPFCQRQETCSILWQVYFLYASLLLLIQHCSTSNVPVRNDAADFNYRWRLSLVCPRIWRYGPALGFLSQQSWHTHNELYNRVCRSMTCCWRIYLLGKNKTWPIMIMVVRLSHFIASMLN